MRAVRQMQVDSLRPSSIELVIDRSCQLARNMSAEHRYLNSFSRSASILCPRLSLDATVPMEQWSALAICS